MGNGKTEEACSLDLWKRRAAQWMTQKNRPEGIWTKET
jgi:hypothetical protein